MANSKFITAYLLRVDEDGKQYQGYFSEVENSLEQEQKYVGGYIQVIRLTDEIDAIINDEGKMFQLPYNRLWKDGNNILDIIVGNIACVRHNDDGEFISIKTEDIDIIQKCLVPIKNVVLDGGNTIITTFPEQFLPKWGGDKNGS